MAHMKKRRGNADSPIAHEVTIDRLEDEKQMLVAAVKKLEADAVKSAARIASLQKELRDAADSRLEEFAGMAMYRVKKCHSAPGSGQSLIKLSAVNSMAETVATDLKPELLIQILELHKPALGLIYYGRDLERPDPVTLEAAKRECADCEVCTDPPSDWDEEDTIPRWHPLTSYFEDDKVWEDAVGMALIRNGGKLDFVPLVMPYLERVYCY